MGQADAGLAVLTEASELVATTEERWWEAEGQRLKGGLLQSAEGNRNLFSTGPRRGPPPAGKIA